MSRGVFDSDPELAELFPGDDDLLELARLVRTERPTAALAPTFEPYLRARLMDAAPTALRPRGLFGHRLRRRAGFVTAGGFALAGAVAVAVTLVSVLHGGSGGSDTTVAIVPVANAIQAGTTNVGTGRTISISFDQKMDHPSVEHALHVQPATEYSVTWSDATAGSTLTISPAHGLSNNTVYVVSVDDHVARATNGSQLAAPVRIPFLTAPPSPTPASTPTAPTLPPLAATVIGQAESTSILEPDGAGGVLVGAGLAPGATAPAVSQATPTATPTSTTATSSASTSSASTAAATATPTAQPPGAVSAGLVHLPPGPAGGQPARLGPTTTAIASLGHSVAYLVPDGDHADVMLTTTDGTVPQRLAADADVHSPLAALGGRILYVSQGRVKSVDVAHVVRDTRAPTLVAGGPAEVVRAGGAAAVLALPASSAGTAPTATATAPATAISTGTPRPATATPSPASTPASVATVHVVDLDNGSTVALPAGAQSVAVAADGSAVVWVERGANSDTVRRAALPADLGTGVQPVDQNLGIDAGAVDSLAVAGAGGPVAVGMRLADGSHDLRVLAPGAGTLVGRVARVTRPVFVDPETVTGLVDHGTGAPADVVLVALGGRGGGGAPSVAPAASALVDQLAAAQAPPDQSRLAGVPVAGSPTPDLAGLTPGDTTQAYAVSLAASADGSTVSAQLRLVHIPASAGGAITSADETATLTRLRDGSFAVSALTVSSPTPVSTGPHVQRVETSGPAGARVVTLTLDSDLDPRTVTAAVTVEGPEGVVSAVVGYDAATRMITLALPPGLDATVPVTVTLGAQLHDVDGTPLAQPFTTSVLP